MPETAEAAAPAAAAPPPDARAARLAQFKRDQVIVDYLNRGVSVSEIAARIGIGEKRTRAVIRDILVRRMPAPPREFLAIQTSRLNEALLVAFSAMGGEPMTALRAVDRVVKVVRELDRYHGFVPGRALPRPRYEEDPDDAALEFLDPVPTARFGASFAAAMTARADPSSLVLRSVAEGDASRRTAAGTGPSFETPASRAPQDEGVDWRLDLPGCCARPENLAEEPEKIESAPGISASPPARGEASRADPSSLVLRSGAEGDASRRTAAGTGPSFETPASRAPQDEGVDWRLDLPGCCTRPENPGQAAENTESAPGLSASPPAREEASRADPSSLVLRSVAEGDASRRTAAGTGPSFETPASRAPQDEGVDWRLNLPGCCARPENPAQPIENPHFTPGSETARPPERAPDGASGLEVLRSERLGQELAEPEGRAHALRPRDVDDGRAVGEFADALAAAAAGRAERRAVADDADRSDPPAAGRGHGGDGARLGAPALGIGRVLDIAAGEDFAFGGHERRADAELRIGGVGVRLRGFRRGEECERVSVP